MNVATKQCIGGLVGSVLGILLAIWIISPKHSATEIEWESKTRVAESIAADQQVDNAIIGTPCAKDGELMKRPHGAIVACKAGVWVRK